MARRLWEGREVFITIYIIIGAILRRGDRMAIGHKALARAGKVLVTRKHRMIEGGRGG